MKKVTQGTVPCVDETDLNNTQNRPLLIWYWDYAIEKNLTNGVVLMGNTKRSIAKFAVWLVVGIRALSTIMSMMGPTLHDCFVSISFFNIPFFHALTFCDTLPVCLNIIFYYFAKIEIPMILLMSIVLIFRNRKLSYVSMMFLAVICIIDVACCIVSYVMLATDFKLLSIVVNIISLMILLYCWLTVARGSVSNTD